MSLDYSMTFAGVPFVDDVWHNVPDLLDLVGSLNEDALDEEQQRIVSPPRKANAVAMVDELDRMSPFVYSTDFKSPLSGNDQFSYSVGIRTGEYYYPATASRWSSFRGLAMSSQVAEMRNQVGNSCLGTFKVVQIPDSPRTRKIASSFTIETSLYLLPPRAVAEGGTGEGLFVVTLVDERYYWQFELVNVTVDSSTTWSQVISAIASELGISVTFTTIDQVYGSPNSDFPSFNRPVRASTLFDLVADSIGRVLVRNLDGTYSLLTPEESEARFVVNRPSANTVVTTAGGDFFYPGDKLYVGNSNAFKNAVVPTSIDISYPRYLFQSGGTYSQVGGVADYQVTVPIASGGSSTSGLTGVGTAFFRSQQRALTSGSSASTPTNASGLVANAMQTAADYYEYQTLEATDQTRPGIVKLLPEGFHTIVWTFSKNRQQSSTRLVRTEWNAKALEYQSAEMSSSSITNQFDFSNVVWFDVNWTFEESTVNFTSNTIVNFVDVTVNFTNVELSFDITTNIFFYGPLYVTGPFYWLYEGDTYVAIDFDNVIRESNYTANNAAGVLEGATEVTLIEAPVAGQRVVQSVTIYNVDPVDAQVYLYLYDEDTATPYYVATPLLPNAISLAWDAPLVLEPGFSIRASVEGTLTSQPQWQSDWFNYPDGWTNANGLTTGTTPVVVWRSPTVGEPVELLACLTVCNRDTANASVTVQFVEDDEVYAMKTFPLRTKQTLIFDEKIVLDRDCKEMRVVLGGAVTTQELTWTCNWREVSDVVETCPGIAIEGGDNQEAEVSTVFGAPLSVLVTDGNDNPLEGYSVTFTPPGAGASCTLSDTVVVTGSDGIAATTATANATEGAYQVPASLTDYPDVDAVNFNLENTAGGGGGCTGTSVACWPEPIADVLYCEIVEVSGGGLPGCAMDLLGFNFEMTHYETEGGDAWLDLGVPTFSALQCEEGEMRFGTGSFGWPCSEAIRINTGIAPTSTVGCPFLWEGNIAADSETYTILLRIVKAP